MPSASSLRPKSKPSRKVTLLPSPRAEGMSPFRLQSNSKGGTVDLEKKAWAASSTILGWRKDDVLEALTRRTRVRVHHGIATPRQSKPGPTFVVDPWT